MIAYSRACMQTEIIKYILTQFLLHHPEESCLRTREEGLAYAAALIVIMIVSYCLLILVPITVCHNFGSINKVLSHHFGYITYRILISGVLERFLTHGACCHD